MSDKHKQLPRMNRIIKYFDNGFKQLNEWIDSPQKIYSSTKDQLQDIKRSMLEMCAKIDVRCGIVDDNTNNSIHNAELHMIHTDIKKLMAMQQHTVVATQQASSETVTERIIEREITRNNASQNVIEQDTSVTAEKSVSKTEYSKKFKRELTLLLRRFCNHDYKSTQINRLLDLINKWYVKRFCTNYRDKGFELYTYGIGQITQGIYTIIAEYAKSVATNSEQDFYADFHNWLDTLGQDTRSTEKDTLPAFLHNSFLHPKDIQIYPHTLILWWAIIAPFKSDIYRFHEQYPEAIDPEYIDNLAYTDEYDAILTEAAEMCPNECVSLDILHRYNLD